MSRSPLTARDASSLERCVRGGGVALFPADTVYGLCCDPENRRAAKRLYELKGRDAERPAAVMFFALERALTALGELEEPERRALEALLPGPVTLLLPNRARRFQAAGGAQGATLGLRVPLLGAVLSALGSVALAVMQSSANLTGGPDASRVADVPASVRDGADLVLDAGELPGTPSSVVDLCSYASDGSFSVVRAGALSEAAIALALGEVH
jgi:L-threonylcarbamoyladenylate synthase